MPKAERAGRETDDACSGKLPVATKPSLGRHLFAHPDGLTLFAPTARDVRLIYEEGTRKAAQSFTYDQ